MPKCGRPTGPRKRPCTRRVEAWLQKIKMSQLVVYICDGEKAGNAPGSNYHNRRDQNEKRNGTEVLRLKAGENNGPNGMENAGLRKRCHKKKTEPDRSGKQELDVEIRLMKIHAKRTVNSEGSAKNEAMGVTSSRAASHTRPKSISRSSTSASNRIDPGGLTNRLFGQEIPDLLTPHAWMYGLFLHCRETLTMATPRRGFLHYPACFAASVCPLIMGINVRGKSAGCTNRAFWYESCVGKRYQK